MSEQNEQESLFPSEARAVPVRLTRSLEWLSSLHARVSVEGVCQKDIAALNEVMEAVANHPIPESVPEVFDVPWSTPALEHYPVQGFTVEPSTLNQSVALEGITQALFQTLQRILRALSGMVSTSLDLLKKAVRNETVAGFKLKNLYGAVAKANEGANQIETKFLRDTSDIEAELVKYRKGLLDGSPIRRTPYQLAALGDREYLPRIESVILRIHRSAPLLERYIAEVRQTLGKKGGGNTEGLAHSPVFEELKTLRWEVEDLSKKDPSKDYVSARSGLMYFPGAPKPRAKFPEKASKLVKYKKQLAMYEQLDKQLTQIWKLNLVGDRTELQPILEGLRKASRAVENLQSVTEFLHRYNQSKRSALKVAYRLENKRFSKLYSAAKETTITEPQRESLQELKDKYTQVIATLLS
jgi:hypothetical protein